MALEKQHVLTKTEKEVMKVVFNESDKQNGVCLLTPIDFYSRLPLDLDFKEEELLPTLKALEIDDYFDLTETERKGELVYCINMRKKGLAFARQEKAFKKNIRFRIGLAIGLAIISGVVGIIIKLIYSAAIG